MMAQLGVLSTVHPQAALEVFEKDCLIQLGSCIAPIGPQKSGKPVLEYELNMHNGIVNGKLMPGEIKMIQAPYEKISAKLTPGNGLDMGNGRNEIVEADVFGGVVGIILDGRGRAPFTLSIETLERVTKLNDWSKETGEYPE